MTDVTEVAQAHTTTAKAVDIPSPPLERASIPETPLYQVEDQRYSGEWRAIGQFTDPVEAQRAAAVIGSAGGNVRILFIERPLIP